MNACVRNICFINYGKLSRVSCITPNSIARQLSFQNSNLRTNYDRRVLQTSRALKLTDIHSRHFSVETFRGWFQSLTESSAVTSAKDVLVTIHDTTGLPWCSCIVLTTLGLRMFLTFPVGVYQTYIIAKLELCKQEMSLLVEELKKETAVAIRRFGWTEAEARRAYNASARKQWRILIERENCHPFKASVVLWIQLPVWILLSLALRSMAYKMGIDPALSEVLAEQLSVEGCLWVPNLLVPDSTGMLPILVCLSNLAIIELQSCSRVNHTKTQKILTNVFRTFAIISFPVAMTVPSCMSIYWCASSTLALAQNAILMSPKVRSAFGIPKTPTQKQTPYKYAWLNFKDKWRIFR